MKIYTKKLVANIATFATAYFLINVSLVLAILGYFVVGFVVLIASTITLMLSLIRIWMLLSKWGDEHV